MHATVYPSQREKAISGAFAFGMHLVFLALLVFGVTWQKRIEPQANIVDLWANLPAPPKIELPPPRPEPVVKPEPKPVEPPPVKVAPKPDVVKPDIAIKEKAKKEKAEKDLRALEEKKKEDKKRDAETKAAQKKQQEAEAEAKRLAREQDDAQRKLAEQATAAQARLLNEYTERIKARIKRFVVMPPNLQGNPQADFDVVLLPGGEVLSVKLKRASGNAAYDSAVERAIHKAAPLPLPPDPAMFRNFRELNLTFRPQE